MANAPALSRLLGGGRSRDGGKLNCILSVPCVAISLLCHMCLLLVGLWLLCGDMHVEEAIFTSGQRIAVGEIRCVQCDPNDHILICYSGFHVSLLCTRRNIMLNKASCLDGFCHCVNGWKDLASADCTRCRFLFVLFVVGCIPKLARGANTLRVAKLFACSRVFVFGCVLFLVLFFVSPGTSR